MNMEGIELVELTGFSRLEQTLGRLALVQIYEQVLSKRVGAANDSLRKFEERVYYDVSEALGIPKGRAEEIRSTVYIKLIG